MRYLFLTCLSLLAIASPSLSAGVPQKPMSHQFNRLVTNSPFTIKPDTKNTAVASPLERDWSLGSIRPGTKGYTVTLINKKDRKDRIRFMPGFSSGEFKLLEVNQNSRSSKDSKVLISKGSQKGWIAYDEKVVALRASKAAKPSSKKKTTSKSQRGAPPIATKGSSKSQRVRHVPRKK